MSTLRNLKLLLEKKTNFQTIRLYETEEGKVMLTLDTFVQFLEGEQEKKYHKMLTQPAIDLHNNPEHFLILGGGDGLAARNIFNNCKKAKITMVELDKEVVDLCNTNEKLKEMNENSLPLCNIHYEDALKWVPECNYIFDIIILDFPDPNNDELKKLYTKKFLTQVIALLAPGGVISIQCHYSIKHIIAKKIIDLLDNSVILTYTMPFLEEGSVVLGKKELEYK
jgi:spermidine synthase